MKFTQIAAVATLVASPVMGSLFFQESKADKIKKHLEAIGYEVTDSAGQIKDDIIESFDQQSLQDWLEAHGIHEKAEQTLETAKEHKDWLLEDIRDYAEQGQEASKKIIDKGKEYYEQGAETASNFLWTQWSDSKLKEFLDARGVNVPQHSSRDQLVALVSRTKHNSPINFKGPAGRYWFDGWSKDDLAKKLHSVGESIEGSRQQLADRLYSSYSKAFEQGKEHGEEAAKKLKTQFGDWKEATAKNFHSWSTDDLKEYLSDFGSDVSGTKDSLVEKAKDNYYYFVHGEYPPKNALERVQRQVTSHFHNARQNVQNYLNKLLGVQAFVRSDL